MPRIKDIETNIDQLSVGHQFKRIHNEDGRKLRVPVIGVVEFVSDKGIEAIVKKDDHWGKTAIFDRNTRVVDLGKTSEKISEGWHPLVPLKP